MENLNVLIAALAVSQVDFIDDSLESPFEQTLVAYGKLHSLSLQLDMANQNDDTVNEVAGGVLNLAKSFGVVFKKLSPDQAQEVKDTVRKIVRGANEELIEQFFDASLDFIVSAQELNGKVDTLSDGSGGPGGGEDEGGDVSERRNRKR